MQLNFFLLAACYLGGMCGAMAQNVGIGTGNPAESKLVVADNKPLIITAANPTSLAANVKTGIAIKTGNYFTGGLYATGTNAAFARMGLYTYASLQSNELRERLTITDSGHVGINDTFPQVLLSINGNGYPTAPTNRRIVLVNNATMVLNGNVGQKALIVNEDAMFSQSYIQVDATSRLGIGLVPAYPLDIEVPSGSMRIRDGNQGTGKVLTSDAAGIAAWANLPTRSAKAVLTATKSFASGTESASFAWSFAGSGGFSDLAGNTAGSSSMTISANQAGTYLVTAQVTWRIFAAFSGTKYFQFTIRRNTSPFAETNMLTTYDNVGDIKRTQTISAIVKLGAGDVVDITASQSSGATQEILAGEALSFFTLTRLY